MALGIRAIPRAPGSQCFMADWKSERISQSPHTHAAPETAKRRLLACYLCLFFQDSSQATRLFWRKNNMSNAIAVVVEIHNYFAIFVSSDFQKAFDFVRHFS